MDLGLKGKIALVTAASRGFGLATARRLAAEGAVVAMCARNPDDLSRGASVVAAAGGEASVLSRVADVTDPAAMARLVDDVTAELGPIDLLLVNAGGPPAGTFSELDRDQWDAAYRLTVASAVDLCRLVLPGMMQRKFGRIVSITSVSVLQPVENLLLSSVLRPAVQALTKTLAIEAGPSGVTANSVAPGFHATSAVDRLITRKIEQTGCRREEVITEWTRDIPVGRLGQPDELAALIVFLMSESAAYITGQCIVADGGWVKGTF